MNGGVESPGKLIWLLPLTYPKWASSVTGVNHPLESLVESHLLALSSGLVSLVRKFNLRRHASAQACVRFLLPNANWSGGGALSSVSLSNVEGSEEESDGESPLDVDTVSSSRT